MNNFFPVSTRRSAYKGTYYGNVSGVQFTLTKVSGGWKAEVDFWNRPWTSKMERDFVVAKTKREALLNIERYIESEMYRGFTEWKSNHHMAS